MNELELTHIESLDSETVTIPGLDVDGALESTIASGKKKLRNKRIKQGATSVALISILGFAFFGITTFLNSEDGNINSDVIQTAQKQFDSVQTTKTEEPPVTQSPVQESVPPTNPAPVIEPKLVSIKSFGNAGLCNISAGSTDPGPGGVVIGPSTSVQTWNPSIGQTRTEVAIPSSRQLVLKNVANNNGVRGAYVDLISGFNQGSSYANITTLGFTYCEQGYKLEISPRNNASGYSITTTSL